jgi:hypothetical protein
MQYVLSLINALRQAQSINVDQVAIPTHIAQQAAAQLELMIGDTILLNFMETQAKLEGYVGKDMSVREHLRQTMKENNAKSTKDANSLR